jgi:hypothetical protein
MPFFFLIGSKGNGSLIDAASSVFCFFALFPHHRKENR